MFASGDPDGADPTRRVPSRQAEGSIGSIISLLGLNPAGAGSYSHSLIACRPVTRGELTDQRCSGADPLADMLVGRAIIVEAAGERRVPGGRSELGHPD